MPPFDESLLRDAEDLPPELRLGLERLQAKRPSPERVLAMAAACGLTAAGSAVAASSAGEGAAALRPDAVLPATGAAPGASSLLASSGLKWLLLAGAVTAGAVVLVLLRPWVPAGTSSVSGRAASTPGGTAASLAEPLSAPGRDDTSVRSRGASGERAAAANPARAAAEPESFTPESLAPERLAPESVTAAEAGKAAVPQPSGASTAPAPASEAPATPARGAPARNSGSERSTASGTHAPGERIRATEVELLRDARQVLESSPLVALSLCDEHSRNYPGGGLAQERELIAIAALLRLGRTTSAEERAGRFRSAYPRSPHLKRLDRLVPP